VIGCTLSEKWQKEKKRVGEIISDLGFELDSRLLAPSTDPASCFYLLLLFLPASIASFQKTTDVFLGQVLDRFI